MKNFLSFFLILILSAPTFAIPGDEKDIRNDIYEIENNLSKNIETKIIQFLGTDQIWLSTQLDVDTKAIRDFLKRQEKEDTNNGKTEGTNITRYTELPGLNLTQEGAVVKDSEDKIVVNIKKELSIDPSVVMAFTSGIKITVYSKVNLERKVERVIRSLVEEKLHSLKVKVDVDFNHRKAQPLDQTDFSEGSKVRFDPDSFAKSFQSAMTLSVENFVTDHLISPMKWGFSIFALLGSIALALSCYFIVKSLWAINQNLSSLSKVIGPRESSSSSIKADNITETGPKLLDSTNSQDSRLDEEKAREKIVEIYENYSEVVSNFFADSMDKRNFQDIWALGQVLGEKLIIENAHLSMHKNYKTYNKYLRVNLFTKSPPSDQVLYQKLMSLMLYPDVYILNSIKIQLSALDQTKTGTFFTQISTEEKGIISEVIDPLRLASLINQGIIKAKEIFSTADASFEIETLRKLDKKISTYIQSFEQGQENIFSFIYFLSSSQYDDYLTSMKIDKKFQFETLYFAHQEHISEFIMNLSVDEISSLLPMVSEAIQEHIYGFLPEIKLARVMQAKKIINGQGQFMISQIYQNIFTPELKQEFVQAFNKSGPGLKIAV